MSLAKNVDYLRGLPKLNGFADFGRTLKPGQRSPIVETKNFESNPGNLRMFSFAPDNLQHFVFPSLAISASGPNIHDATVTWSGFTSGAISFEGLIFGGPGGNVTEGITVTYDGANTYQLTGTA